VRVAGRSVNWSVLNADRTTHLRIVLIAVVAAVIVVIVGKSAQLDRGHAGQTLHDRSYTASGTPLD
jgi:hypothetical protein